MRAGRGRQVRPRPWYSGGMRKVVVPAVLLLSLLAGGWLVLGGETPRTGDDARGSEARAPVVELERDRASSKPEVKEIASKPSKHAKSKEDREAMRRRIVDAMQARERAAGEREGGAAKRGGGATPPRRGSDEATRKGEAKAPDDEAPTPGNLIDRTGNHGHMVKVLNEDLMPLVDECYALARETQPELTGMLVLDVEMIGDEEVGAVVESAVLGQGNEIVDPALVECVQESLLSTTLPPPPEGGKEAFQLQMRLEPEAG
jgi:hypothetical protein